MTQLNQKSVQNISFSSKIYILFVEYHVRSCYSQCFGSHILLAAFQTAHGVRMTTYISCLCTILRICNKIAKIAKTIHWFFSIFPLVSLIVVSIQDFSKLTMQILGVQTTQVHTFFVGYQMSKLQLLGCICTTSIAKPFLKKEIKMCDVGCCVRCQILRKWSTSTEKNSKEHEEDLHWSTYLLTRI